MDEGRRSFSELQEETKSQISHARAFKDSDQYQIMENYRKTLSYYVDEYEKSLYESVRNGIETATIVRGSAEVIRKSNFGFKHWIYKFNKEYRDYKKLKKLSTHDFLIFQDKVALYFQRKFLKNLKLLFDKIQDNERIIDLSNLTLEEKDILKKV